MKKGKFEKLRKKWEEAGCPAISMATSMHEDFAYWLDQRREAKKAGKVADQVKAVELPTDWQFNNGIPPNWPVDTEVEVVLRDDTKVEPRRVGRWRWGITNGGGDIMIYRVAM
jgi:hypothetical protein